MWGSVFYAQGRYRDGSAGRYPGGSSAPSYDLSRNSHTAIIHSDELIRASNIPAIAFAWITLSQQVQILVIDLGRNSGYPIVIANIGPHFLMAPEMVRRSPTDAQILE